MRVIVTGVAGFIGSHLAERLVGDGHEVVGVDCFTDYYPRRLKEQNLGILSDNRRFRLIEADLMDLNLVALLRGEVNGWLASRPVEYAAAETVVFHLAAQAGVRESWNTNFDAYARSNILATQRVLEATRAVPIRKLVYASSSVYGDAEAYPTTEGLTPQPFSPYGVTKLAGEHLCQLYWRNLGVPVVSLRYFSAYGPRQRPDMAFHRFPKSPVSRRGSYGVRGWRADA